MKTPIFWNVVPPPSPFLGCCWIDPSLSTVSPVYRVFDGNSFITVATIDTLALSLNPLVSTITSDGGAVDLGTSEPIVVLTAGSSTSVGSWGQSSHNAWRVVVFGGTLFCWGVDTPRQSALVTSFGDAMTVVATPSGGWRLLSYQASGLLAELSLHAMTSGLAAVTALGVITRGTWQGSLAVSGTATFAVGATRKTWQGPIAVSGTGGLAAVAT